MNGLLAVALTTFTGCVEQTPLEPTADAYVVHAVLDADARDQYVIVQRTRGLAGNQVAVTAAVVTITTPAGRALIADEVRDSTVVVPTTDEPRASTVYRVSLDKYGEALVPGGRYLLHISVPGAPAITGTTILPDGSSTAASAPSSEAFDRTRDTLRVAWATSAFARSYQVSVRSELITFTKFTAFSDRSITVPGTAFGESGLAVFRAGLINQVTVLAVDANYYDYYRSTSDFFSSSGVVSSLNGAIGFFGSIARVKRRELLVR